MLCQLGSSSHCIVFILRVKWSMTNSWTASPWRWGHCDPSKCQILCTQHHSITSQKNWIFSNTNENPTTYKYFTNTVKTWLPVPTVIEEKNIKSEYILSASLSSKKVKRLMVHGNSSVLSPRHSMLLSRVHSQSKSTYLYIIQLQAWHTMKSIGESVRLVSDTVLHIQADIPFLEPHKNSVFCCIPSAITHEI